MGLGGFFSPGGTDSRAESGVPLAQREQAAKRGLGVATRASRDIEDFARSNLPQLQFSRAFPGLFAGSERAVEGIADTLYSRASAGGARRGQLTPEGSRAAAGSALNEATKFFFPTIQENLRLKQLFPEEQRFRRLGLLSSAPSLFSPFLQGGTSSMKQRESGPGFEFGKQFFGSMGSSLGSSTGAGIAGMFCWMAAAMYGPLTNEHLTLARLIRTSNSKAAKKARALYAQYMPVFEELMKEANGEA